MEKQIYLTTINLPHEMIDKYLGVVSGCCVQSRSFVKDWIASFKEMLGGEIGAYTEMLEKAREKAMERMVEKARKLGADAVIGITVTSVPTSMIETGSSLGVIVQGTAIRFRRDYDVEEP